MKECQQTLKRESPVGLEENSEQEYINKDVELEMCVVWMMRHDKNRG